MKSETRMKWQDIKVGTNPRKDFGDLKELKESIKQHGLLMPIVVNKEGVIIDGGRRYAAIKELYDEKMLPEEFFPKGNIEIMMRDVETDTHAEMSLVANLQRKDLTPLEEARAFDAYIKKVVGSNALMLGTKIGKSEQYVSRRIALLALGPEAQKAMLAGKITVTHAGILAQMSAESQKGILKQILENRLTPQMLVDQLAFADLDPEDLPDEVKQKVSKQGQTTFENVGSELTYEARNMAQHAKKELAAYLERERQALKDKNISVFTSQAELKKKHKLAEQVERYSYSGHKYDYDAIVKALPNSTEFAVVVSFEHGVKRDLYCLNPKEYLAKVKEAQKVVKKGKAEKAASEEDTAKQLNLDRKERLKRKVEEFKHEWHKEQSAKQLKPGKLAMAIVLHDSDGAQDLKKLLEMTPAQLEKIVHERAQAIIEGMPKWEAEAVAPVVGVDPVKHFEITHDFLELHTSDQLRALAKELKIPEIGDGKKDEIIEELLLAVHKGMVPKVFEKA